MKNISLILNGVLALAVLILYILHFSSQGAINAAEKKEKASTKKENKTITKDNKGNATYRFAYVNSDTLLLKYDFYKDTKADLEKKQRVIQTDLRNRQSALQNEALAYQKGAYNMTQQKAAETEKLLMAKERELVQYGQNVEAGYLKEEQKLNEKLYNNIADFLKVYAEENDYTYIFGYSRVGGGVLFADSALDITVDVLNGLNEEYKNEQKKDKK